MNGENGENVCEKADDGVPSGGKSVGLGGGIGWVEVVLRVISVALDMESSSLIDDLSFLFQQTANAMQTIHRAKHSMTNTTLTNMTAMISPLIFESELSERYRRCHSMICLVC